MNVFSPEFLALFFIAVIVITLRARKKKGTGPLPGKQISIRGSRLETFLTKELPLVCLLADGRFYGDDYQEKQVPTLPHQEGCRCEIKEIIRRSREMAEGGSKDDGIQMSDLGPLNKSDARFYRFALIGQHPDAAKAIKSEYLDLAGNVNVSDSFRKRIESHLAD